jgi:hypothetical protein
MAGLTDYTTVERLRDGRAIEIRVLRPDDRDEIFAAIGRTSTQSLQLRKGFSEQEIAFFLNIDFENHVALVAQLDEDGRPAIADGGRYIVVRHGRAEIAFMVVDAYQAKGSGPSFMRHLAVLARRGPQGSGRRGVAPEYPSAESV